MAKSFPNTGATVGLAADRSALSSPFAGMQFFETDTKALYLYNGSAWVNMLDTDTPPGLVFINKTTFTTSSSVEVDNVFTSVFNRYHVLLTVSATSSASSTAIGLSFNESGTRITTSSYYFGVRALSQTGTNNDGAGNGLTYISLGEVQTAVPNLQQSFDILGVGSSSSGLATAVGGGFSNVSSSYGSRFFSGVYNGGGTTFTGFDVFPASGTISGNISVYGYREP
jgi:hypothetical protein